MAETNQNPAPAIKPKEPSVMENFRAQVAAGPLPGMIAQIKAYYQIHRAQLVFTMIFLILLFVLLFGLAFGNTLARIFRPQDINVPLLPTVTPTQIPVVPSSFDSLRDQVRSFSGILPDPAPPAVDDNINLQPPKR